MARQGICEAENVQLFLLKWALIVINVLFWVSNSVSNITCGTYQ